MDRSLHVLIPNVYASLGATRPGGSPSHTCPTYFHFVEWAYALSSSTSQTLASNHQSSSAVLPGTPHVHSPTQSTPRLESHCPRAYYGSPYGLARTGCRSFRRHGKRI